MIKYKILLLVTLGGTIMANVFGGKEYDEPLFELEFSVQGVEAEVYLNDIPVLRYSDSGMLSSRKPIPEYVINGENVVRVVVSPVSPEGYSDSVSVDIVLLVREKAAPQTEGETLLHLQVNPSASGSEIIAGSSESLGSDMQFEKRRADEVIAERSVRIDAPVSQWPWQRGEVIEKTDDNYNALFAEYEKVYSVLRHEDLQKAKKLYSAAAKDYAAAYHYNDLDSAYDLMNIGGHFGKSEWVLGDIHKLSSKREYVMQVFANGRLARIVDLPNQRSPIMYLNKENRLIDFKKFMFYKPEKDRWVMIR